MPQVAIGQETPFGDRKMLFLEVFWVQLPGPPGVWQPLAIDHQKAVGGYRYMQLCFYRENMGVWGNLHLPRHPKECFLVGFM